MQQTLGFNFQVYPISHTPLTEEQQSSGSLTPDRVRLSVDIEHSDDIGSNLVQAFPQV